MSNRHPGYLCGLIVSAGLATLPLIASCSLIALISFGGPQWSTPYILQSALRSIPWIGDSATNAIRLTYAPFWNGHFVYLDGGKSLGGGSDQHCSLWGIDPETGKNISMNLSFDCRPGLFPTVFGDRLWLVEPSMNRSSSIEIVDGQAKRSDFVDDPFRDIFPGGQRLLLNGEPALVESDDEGFVISICSEGEWTSKYAVDLPDIHAISTIGSTELFFSQASQMSCLNLGGEIHVLLKVGGHLLYRRGLKLKPILKEETESEAEGHESMGELPELSEVASEPFRRTTVEDVAGWSIVRSDVTHGFANLLWVDGEPVVLVIDDVQTRNPIGNLYRYHGDVWKLAATRSFPFAYTFHSVATHDGSKSYLCALEPLGVNRIYAIELGGIRATAGVADAIPQGLLCLTIIYVGVLVLTSAGVGVACWMLMSKYTQSDYGFGNRTVHLASLRQRALARCIDTILAICLILGFGWFFGSGFDGLVLIQALQSEGSHPVIHAASKFINVLGIWAGVLFVVFVAIQGRWGVTPGKLCVGIRTKRSTLRPCGFGRSLAREIMMCVDACNALWWVPGIVTIALTGFRQRLGDLVADTIVVER